MMNFLMWKGELEIFEKDSYLEDSDDPILHIWQSQGDKVEFIINQDYELIEHDGLNIIQKKNV